MNAFRATALLATVAAAGAASCDGGVHDGGPGDGIDAVTDAFVCMDGMVTDDAGACVILGRDESQCADLVLGTGRDGSLEEWRPYAPGDVVYVTPGEQGLQHIFVAFRGRGFDPTNPLVTARIVRIEDCHIVGAVRFRLPFTADPSDPTLFELPTVRVVLLDPTDPLGYCTILGKDVMLVADIDDAEGHRAHREMRLHVGGIDPNARPDLQQAWLDACTRDGGAVVDP